MHHQLEQLSHQQLNINEPTNVGIGRFSFEAILQWISYIVYGVIAGMIPALFKLANLPSAKPDMVEIMGAINLVLSFAFSIGFVCWMFATDLKQQHRYLYYLSHLINALALLLPTILVAITPITTQGQTSSQDVATNIYWRQMLIVIGLAVHSVIMAALSGFLWVRFHKDYGLTQSRLVFVNLGWIVLLLGPIATFVGASYNLDNLPDITWYMITLATPLVWLLTTITSAIMMLWVRRKRHILLGDLTHERLVTISDQEFIKTGALFSAMVGAAVFLIAFNWENINQVDPLMWAEVALNVILIAIMATIGIVRFSFDLVNQRREAKQFDHDRDNKFSWKLKPFTKMQMWCKQQDMLLIFESLFMVLIVKALIFQVIGLITFDWQNNANLHPLPFQLAICTTLCATIYLSFKPFVVPKVAIYNLWSTVAMVMAALATFVFISVFASLYGIDDQFPPFLPALLISFTLFALGCALLSQIILYSGSWSKRRLERLNQQYQVSDPLLQVSDPKAILAQRAIDQEQGGRAPDPENHYIDQAYVKAVQNRESQILN